MDLSITKFTHDLPISNVSVLSFDPFVLILTGDDFSSVRDILINDTPVERFEVGGRGNVLIEVPLSLGGDLLSSITVISSGPVRASTEASVSFALDDMSLPVSGISALVQRFLKILLTTPDSSYQNPDEGGGLLSMLGVGDGEELSEDALSSAVSNVEEYMFSDPNLPSLPASERLNEAEVVSVSWDRDTQTASLSIKITNQLGETTTTGVTT
jgi:hypothetical protein